MSANTYGRQVILSLTNKSGGSVAAGDVVVVDTTNNDAFTTNTAGAFTGGVGVAQETIASNASGRVLTAGYAALVNVNASVTRGNFGKTHTVAKQATDAGASRVAGTFCQFLTGGTTPDALIYPVDLTGVSLTNPMTTAQDIIVGGSSGTPGRLPIGAAGGGLVSLNSVLAYNSGTSMPANKATGDRYWRTDLGLEFYWDGTRWVSVSLYYQPFGIGDLFNPATGSGATIGRMSTWNGVYDLWVVSIYGVSVVITTNDGTKFWTIAFNRQPTGTAIGSFNTSADTVGAYSGHTVTVGALLGTAERMIEVVATKTSTPGSLFLSGALAYRLVGT